MNKYGYDPIIRDIPGFSNYQISENGEVYKKNTGYELAHSLNKEGYEVLTLVENNVSKQKFVHRLLAEVFIENPRNYEVVDHRDRNRTNNNLSNLRWVTLSQNSTNSTLATNNLTGHTGVCKISDKRDGRVVWRAHICKHGTKTTKEFPFTNEGFQRAVEWRKQKETELHTYN